MEDGGNILDFEKIGWDLFCRLVNFVGNLNNNSFFDEH